MSFWHGITCVSAINYAAIRSNASFQLPNAPQLPPSVVLDKFVQTGKDMFCQFCAYDKGDLFFYTPDCVKGMVPKLWYGIPRTNWIGVLVGIVFILMLTPITKVMIDKYFEEKRKNEPPKGKV